MIANRPVLYGWNNTYEIIIEKYTIGFKHINTTFEHILIKLVLKRAKKSPRSTSGTQSVQKNMPDNVI